MEKYLLYLSSTTSRFLDFFHWMVFDLLFCCLIMTVKTIYMITANLQQFMHQSHLRKLIKPKGPGKRGQINCCGHIIVADTNVSPLPARATFVTDTNFVSGTQKVFTILFRNILCPQQMFPSLRDPRNIMGNNVSSFTRALKHDEVYLISEQNFKTLKHVALWLKRGV